MSLWRELESHLSAGQTFSAAGLAYELGIDTVDASRMIQSHLDAQRRPKSATLHTLWRTGRTSASVWHVGERAADVRGNYNQWKDDTVHRVLCALVPDSERMGNINPRVRQIAEAIVNAVAANLELMAAGSA